MLKIICFIKEKTKSISKISLDEEFNGELKVAQPETKSDLDIKSRTT